MMTPDPLTLLREPAQRYALILFHHLLMEMVEAGHAPGTVSQGKWWAKNLARFMETGALPGRREADPRLQAQMAE